MKEILNELKEIEVYVSALISGYAKNMEETPVQLLVIILERFRYHLDHGFRKEVI